MIFQHVRRPRGADFLYKFLACGVIPRGNHPCQISSRFDQSLVKGFLDLESMVTKTRCFTVVLYSSASRE